MPRDRRPEDDDFGTIMPRCLTEIPGPESRRLAERLALVESPNITQLEGVPPIFWAAARGANVLDADENLYIDLTSGFGVTATGHSNPRVAAAIGEQAARLAHGMGDVYPPEIKVRLLERLAEVAPGDLSVTILASAGAEAVEAALKTATIHTGRTGVIAFTGSYHGLTLGALATTWHTHFRGPFQSQLFEGVHFAPFPHERAQVPGDPVDHSIAEIRRIIATAERSAAPIGAILVEPIQGRGGILVPPPDFHPRLRELSDEDEIVLIHDEIYTGFGRTGRWFASEHWDTVPDLMAVGKALTGALPLSAAIGRPEIMHSWPPSAGEAIHTSTFLGNPVAAAAALAEIDEIEREDLVRRTERLGEWLRGRLEEWRTRYRSVGDIRGLGLLQGVELVEGRDTMEPAPSLASRIAERALQRGLILLTEGPAANILALVPPLVITKEQLGFALDVIEDELQRAELE